MEGAADRGRVYETDVGAMISRLMLNVSKRMHTSDYKMCIRPIFLHLIKISVGLIDLREIDFPEDVDSIYVN